MDSLTILVSWIFRKVASELVVFFVCHDFFLRIPKNMSEIKYLLKGHSISLVYFVYGGIVHIFVT